MRIQNRGSEAEEIVAEYLSKKGWKILAKNWRRVRCEIDIVAEKKAIVYFVEVKFRSSDYQGDGLEYITSKKIKQMKLAADIWLQENNWRGDFRLIGASVEPAAARLAVKEIVEIT